MQRFNSLAQAQESNRPKPKQDSEMPWWLADVDPIANVPVAAAIPRQARVREPERATAFYPVPPPSEPQPEMPPAQSWERVSSRRNDLVPAASAEEVQRAGEEDNPNDAASRLSGLRNLLFSLGLKNLNNAQVPSAHDDESLPQSEAGSEYEGYKQIHTAPQEPAPVPVAPAKSNVADTSVRLVTAQPEFLPPKSVVVTIDKDQAQQTGATNRHDRRDAFDEVEILPSWRGQYRKKD